MVSFAAVLTDGALIVRPALETDAIALAVERDAESRRFLGDEPGSALPLACIEVTFARTVDGELFCQLAEAQKS